MQFDSKVFFRVPRSVVPIDGGLFVNRDGEFFTKNNWQEMESVEQGSGIISLEAGKGTVAFLTSSIFEALDVNPRYNAFMYSEDNNKETKMPSEDKFMIIAVDTGATWSNFAACVVGDMMFPSVEAAKAFAVGSDAVGEKTIHIVKVVDTGMRTMTWGM